MTTLYTFRFVSFLRPYRREKINDVYFTKLLGYVGGHQRAIDASRCHKLTYSFPAIARCTSLMYLDLSFTSFADLSILEGLHCLKSLLIAGVAIKELSCLTQLDTIEILSVRHCATLSSLTVLTGLPILRSLDFGYCTRITSLTPLSQLTRLEELAMDSSGVIGLSDVMSTLSCLPELRILNIENTPLADEENVRESLLSVLREDVCIEILFRDTQFLLAVIDNDTEAVWNFIGSGGDINVRASLDLNEIMVDKWTEVYEASTVFVLCDHEDEDLRPTAVHLAIVFQSLEALEVLIYCGADQHLRCWMSFVDVDQGTLFYSEEKEQLHIAMKQAADSTYRLKTVFDAQDLSFAAFENHFCRFVRGFKRDRIMNWKEIGNWTMCKINSILDGGIDDDPEFHSKGPEPSRNKAATISRERTKSMESAGSRTSRGRSNSLEGSRSRSNSLEYDKDIAMFSREVDDDDRSMVSMGSIAESLRSFVDTKSVQEWPLMRGQLPWRQLPMVRKQSGAPLRVRPTQELRTPETTLLERLRPGVLSGNIIQEEADPGKVNVLGKKSYWMESLKAAVQERQRMEIQHASRARFKPSLHRTKAPPPAELLLVPLVDRREKFFADMKKEADREPVIRDDFADLQEEQDNS